MSYKAIVSRLAALEEDDATRLERAQLRVLDQLTDAEFDCFTVICQRTPPGGIDQPTWAEWAVLRRVDALMHADAEFRPGDCISRPCPLAWKEEDRCDTTR
jgi:hypothetical protein